MNRQVTAIFIETANTSSVPPERLKRIVGILDDQSLLPEPLFETLRWAAGYYHHPGGEVFQTALPVKLRQGVPLFETTELWKCISNDLEVELDKLHAGAHRQRALLQFIATNTAVSNSEIRQQGFNVSLLTKLEQQGLIVREIEDSQPDTRFNCEINAERDAITLNASQAHAVQHIQSTQGFACHLLNGITGSGKTEVYMRAMESHLKAGRQCLLLVPEIGLTPQTAQRFERRFSSPVVTLHSNLTDAERLNAWRAARQGQVGIIIGTRSAVFTPMARPGLIVIDEEHDSSFKQQDGFRYSARDIAIKRAQLENITVILGSATPSLESLNNANKQKFSHLELEQRAGEASLPAMSIADVSELQLDHGFSEQLLLKIGQQLSKGNQVLVFINRRGYAPALQCQNCAWISECDQCIAQLTVHAKPPSLRCHHCDTVTALPQRCPNCHSDRLHTLGIATQKLEQFLNQYFEQFPVLRIDRDSTRNRNSLHQLLDTIQQGQPSILVGTQMLAKGHHFPGVTLVAILDADIGLFSPDFRGQEQMAQTIIQVAGRAGRSQKTGEVVIQSRHATHPALANLVRMSYTNYAEQLLQERQAAGMPPFSYLALLRVDSTQLNTGSQFAQSIYKRATIVRSSQIDLLGPVPAPMEKKAGRFRINLLCRSGNRGALQQFLQRLCEEVDRLKTPTHCRWSLDVDPLDLI